MNNYLHYTCPYLLDPTHPITINLIGVGGTGCQVLKELARIHACLLELGHPGFMVTVFDADIVTKANLGRQLFSVSDIGLNKATLLISRINRFYGLIWKAVPYMYTKKLFYQKDKSSRHALCERLANITITCVDTAGSRISIASLIAKGKTEYCSPYEQPYYWLDFGNKDVSGQVILGTLQEIPQPKGIENTKSCLATVTEMFPNLIDEDIEQQNIPSCSLAEALLKQDLLINSTLAQFGCGLIWKLFRKLKISTQGVYVNVETERVNPIPITG